MAEWLTLARTLAAILLRGAEAGTLGEIARTALRLVTLVRPLLADPAMQRAAADLAARLDEGGLRPAQPDDPAMARQGQSRFGGR